MSEGESSSSCFMASPSSASSRTSPGPAPGAGNFDLNTFASALPTGPGAPQFYFRQGPAKPYLQIVEEPQHNFRFRYKSEMVGTHGCLLGRRSKNKSKTHPSVELKNYTGSARIRCRLVQVDSVEDHPHQLQNDDTEEHVDISHVVGPSGYQLGFPGMGIIHTAKKNVAEEMFKQKVLPNMDAGEQQNLLTWCEERAKKINLNIVRLKFTAHHLETDQLICTPVFSHPIHNMKSAQTNELKIDRISLVSGSVQGNEEIFMFVEKVNRKNIQVRFIELNEDGQEVWSALAHFTQADVHHQYGIVFKTPRYQNPEVTKEVKVYLELVRPQDGRTSERMAFTYKPDMRFVANKKRKAKDLSSFSSLDTSSGSLKSIDLPLTIKHEIKKKLSNEFVENRTSTAQPTASEYMPNCAAISLADALYQNMVDATAQSAQPVLASPAVPVTPVPVTCTGSFTLSTEFNNSDIINQALAEVAHSNDFKHCMEALCAPDGLYRQYAEEQWAVEPMDTGSFLSGITNHFVNFNTTGLKTDGVRKLQQDTKQMFETDMVEKVVVKKEPYLAHFKSDDGAEVKRDDDDDPDQLMILDLHITGTMHHLVSEIAKKNKTNPKSWLARQLEKLMDIKMTNGDTFLHMILCKNQSIQMTEYLVKLMRRSGVHKTLIDIQNNQGETLLHLAIKYDYPKYVSFFMANGCNPMLEDQKGNNAIHTALLHSKKECTSDCFKSLMNAIKDYKKLGICYNLDAYNNQRETPVLLAAKYGYSACLKELIDAGASLFYKDGANRLPLHLAVFGDHLKVTELLLRQPDNLDVDCEDSNGNTPLQIACSGGNRENELAIAQLLLKKGANPMKKTGRNDCPVRLAYNQPQMLALLREYMDPEEAEVKSEPEDYESAEESSASEDESEQCPYAEEIVRVLNRSDKWKEMAERLEYDEDNLFENKSAWVKRMDPRTLATLLHEIGENYASDLVLNTI